MIRIPMYILSIETEPGFDCFSLVLCLQCCLKCPGGVCTKACNKMLLKEIFDKMYKQNKERIKKLEYFMRENKKRIRTSETRISKCVFV